MQDIKKTGNNTLIKKVFIQIIRQNKNNVRLRLSVFIDFRANNTQGIKGK